MTSEERQVAREIGEYYLQKNNGNYCAAEDEILRLYISRIDVCEDIITIVTGRPGALIGKRGINIDCLGKAIGKKIRIIEDMECITGFLIPRPQEMYDDY
jgi:ribosomal protein S3